MNPCARARTTSNAGELSHLRIILKQVRLALRLRTETGREAVSRYLLCATEYSMRQSLSATASASGSGSTATGTFVQTMVALSSPPGGCDSSATFRILSPPKPPAGARKASQPRPHSAICGRVLWTVHRPDSERLPGDARSTRIGPAPDLTGPGSATVPKRSHQIQSSCVGSPLVVKPHKGTPNPQDELPVARDRGWRP